MSSVKIVLRKERIDMRGEAPLYIRVIKNRKPRYISLSKRIKPKDWDEKLMKVKKSHPNSQRMNNYIAKKMSEAEAEILKLETDKKVISTKRIKENILGKSPDSFMNYFKNFVDNLETGASHGHYKRVKTVYTKLLNYADGKNIMFDELTVTFLKKYEKYLSEKLGNKANTIHANFRVIRKVVNEAISEDVFSIEKNPFNKFKLKLEKTKIDFLTEDEIQKIEDLELDKSSKRNHHRNIFVFACYAGGIRISDLLQLKWSNYDGERIFLITKKTSDPVSIKLPEKAKNIIAMYHSDDVNDDAFIFPFLRNDKDYLNKKVLHNAISSATAYANKDLKEIAKLAGLDKHVHFHTSRHTFATMALRRGMRIENVSKLLTHSSIKTTQIYAKIVNKDLDDAMDEFFD